MQVVQSWTITKKILADFLRKEGSLKRDYLTQRYVESDGRWIYLGDFSFEITFNLKKRRVEFFHRDNQNEKIFEIQNPTKGHIGQKFQELLQSYLKENECCDSSKVDEAGHCLSCGFVYNDLKYALCGNSNLLLRVKTV